MSHTCLHSRSWYSFTDPKQVDREWLFNHDCLNNGGWMNRLSPERHLATILFPLPSTRSTLQQVAQSSPSGQWIYGDVMFDAAIGDSDSVKAKRRLRLFGHLARADPSQDHSCILRAASHQSSSSGLTTPGMSTKADMALYNRARPSAT